MNNQNINNGQSNIKQQIDDISITDGFDQTIPNYRAMHTENQYKPSSSKNQKPMTTSGYSDKPSPSTDRITEESAHSEAISGQLKSVDDNYQKEFNKDYSLLDRWTNRTMYKQVVESRKQLFAASGEYRMQFYRTVLDGRLGALKEKTNAGLMMVKGHYRQQVAAFMLGKMNELARDVNQNQQQFLSLMKSKHDYVHQLDGYPDLQRPYLESVIMEGERYMRFCDSLILRFEQIIDEQISRLGEH